MIVVYLTKCVCSYFEIQFIYAKTDLQPFSISEL